MGLRFCGIPSTVINRKNTYCTCGCFASDTRTTQATSSTTRSTYLLDNSASSSGTSILLLLMTFGRHCIGAPYTGVSTRTETTPTVISLSSCTFFQSAKQILEYSLLFVHDKNPTKDTFCRLDSRTPSWYCTVRSALEILVPRDPWRTGVVALTPFLFLC
jgi:hypothetical protein